MKKLTLEDIVEGEYYYEHLNNGMKCINLALNNTKPKCFINITDSEFLPKPSSRIYCEKELRLATPFERFWLDECIRVRKFVKKKDVEKIFNQEPQYEIY